MNKFRYIAEEELQSVSRTLSKGCTITWTGHNWRDMFEFLITLPNYKSHALQRDNILKFACRSKFHFEQNYSMRVGDTLAVVDNEVKLHQANVKETEYERTARLMTDAIYNVNRSSEILNELKNHEQ